MSFHASVWLYAARAFLRSHGAASGHVGPKPSPGAVPRRLRFGHSSTHNRNGGKYMAIINLRDYYPFYTSDCFMEVSEEIADMFKEFDRREAAYRLRTYRHKRVKIKKPNELYKQILFDTMQDAKSIEILHIGTYDDEPISFQKMDLLAKENDLVRSTNYHREIYLNNANRVLKSKLKTILRYCVK